MTEASESRPRAAEPKRLAARRLKRGILTDREVQYLTKRVRAVLGENLAQLVSAYNVSFEGTVRFEAVRTRCVEARENLGQSIRDVSRTLGVPQYRLKDIESSRVREIDPRILERYVSHLGIKRWFRRWCNANQALASALGLETRSAPK